MQKIYPSFECFCQKITISGSVDYIGWANFDIVGCSSAPDNWHEDWNSDIQPQQIIIFYG